MILFHTLLHDEASAAHTTTCPWHRTELKSRGTCNVAVTAGREERNDVAGWQTVRWTTRHWLTTDVADQRHAWLTGFHRAAADTSASVPSFCHSHLSTLILFWHHPISLSVSAPPPPPPVPVCLPPTQSHPPSPHLSLPPTQPPPPRPHLSVSLQPSPRPPSVCLPPTRPPPSVCLPPTRPPPAPICLSPSNLAPPPPSPHLSVSLQPIPPPHLSVSAPPSLFVSLQPSHPPSHLSVSLQSSPRLSVSTSLSSLCLFQLYLYPPTRLSTPLPDPPVQCCLFPLQHLISLSVSTPPLVAVRLLPPHRPTPVCLTLQPPQSVSLHHHPGVSVSTPALVGLSPSNPNPPPPLSLSCLFLCVVQQRLAVRSKWT